MAQPRTDTKRHLIAAAMSTVLPGAGQLFLGRRTKAIFLFVALIAIASGFWLARLPRFYAGILFLIWMCILVCLFAVFDALLAQDTRLPGRMSRWWIAAGLPLHCLSVNLVFTSLLFGSGFHTMKSAASSMEPGISVGDKFVADEHYYHHHPVGRCDLVIIRRPDGLMVKRIIAIGGDTIEGKERKIFLNGKLQDEPFVQHKFAPGADAGMDTFGPVAIPSGKYFVMGDNRDVSLDSRAPELGLVDARDIVGRPLYGYRIVGNPLSWELN
jgi:signal peptidase I